MYEKNFFLKSWFRKSLQFLPVATASISWATKLYRVGVGIFSLLVTFEMTEFVQHIHFCLPLMWKIRIEGYSLEMNETIMANEQYYINGIWHTDGWLLVELSPFIYKKFPFRAFIGTLKCFELFDVFEHFNCEGEFQMYCVPKRYQTIFTESLYFIEVC